jgi:hypothetical protein
VTQTAAKIVIEPIFEADADRAHVQVTVTDVPGDLVWIVGAAAGETGHPHDSSSRETWKPLRDGTTRRSRPKMFSQDLVPFSVHVANSIFGTNSTSVFLA